MTCCSLVAKIIGHDFTAWTETKYYGYRYLFVPISNYIGGPIECAAPGWYKLVSNTDDTVSRGDFNDENIIGSSVVGAKNKSRSSFREKRTNKQNSDVSFFLVN